MSGMIWVRKGVIKLVERGAISITAWGGPPGEGLGKHNVY